MPVASHLAAVCLLAATLAVGGCASGKKATVDPQIEANREAALADAALQQARARHLAVSAATFRDEAAAERATAAAEHRRAQHLDAQAHALDLDAASAYAAGLAYDDLLDRRRAADAEAAGDARARRAAQCRAKAATLRVSRDTRIAHADQLDADARLAMSEARDLLAESRDAAERAETSYASAQ